MSNNPEYLGCEKECSTPVYKFKLDSYGSKVFSDTRLDKQNILQEGTIYFKACIYQMAQIQTHLYTGCPKSPDAVLQGYISGYPGTTEMTGPPKDASHP
jgi:hypothetical protein